MICPVGGAEHVVAMVEPTRLNVRAALRIGAMTGQPDGAGIAVLTVGAGNFLGTSSRHRWGQLWIGEIVGNTVGVGATAMVATQRDTAADAGRM
jgi:hypothetical protein